MLSTLRQRLEHKRREDAILEQVAALRNSNSRENHEIDGRNSNSDSDLQTTWTNSEALRQDRYTNEQKGANEHDVKHSSVSQDLHESGGESECRVDSHYDR